MNRYKISAEALVVGGSITFHIRQSIWDIVRRRIKVLYYIVDEHSNCIDTGVETLSKGDVLKYKMEKANEN